MNSFTLTAVGNLARNPEAVAKGDITYTRFLLVGNDYAGKDDEGAPREIVTSLWFVAFGALAESLARSARKGDQLFIEARVRANNRPDKQGEKQYDHDFVVQGFRFGAPGKIKREERDARREDAAHRDERSNGRGGGSPTVSDGDGGGANGSGSSNATSANGTYGSSGSKGANPGKGTNNGSGANGSDAANAGKGVNGGTATSSGTGGNKGASANTGNSVNAGGDAITGSGPSAGADVKASDGNSTANGSTPTAGEKPAASSRSGRRAASPPP